MGVQLAVLQKPRNDLRNKDFGTKQLPMSSLDPLMKLICSYFVTVFMEFGIMFVFIKATHLQAS